MSAWVPIQESGITFSHFEQNGATFNDSTGEAINITPSLDGRMCVIQFQSGIEYANNLNLGWTGRVRMTVLSYQAVSPGAGEPFINSRLAQTAGGDALVSEVVNTEPPYPGITWGASDVTAFTPAEFIGDVSTEFEFLDDGEGGGEWIGPNQVFSIDTQSMTTVSYTVYFEVEMNAVEECFWTDLINAVQEC